MIDPGPAGDPPLDRDGQVRLARAFDAQRPRLRAVAYRMLGSWSDVDDAIQETWLRLARVDSASVLDLESWLIRVIGRLCLDMLRARRSRHEESRVPLPDPEIGALVASDPGQQAESAESIGLAMLVVLDTLDPAERLALVLHDVFDVPFGTIAAMLDRSPAAARQLASRARRRVRDARVDGDRDVRQQRIAVEAFRRAATEGDLVALIELLHPDVVLRIGAPSGSPWAAPEVRGAEPVAREVLRRARFARAGALAHVNGAVGLVVGPLHAPVGVAAFTIVGGSVTQLVIVADPALPPRR